MGPGRGFAGLGGRDGPPLDDEEDATDDHEEAAGAVGELPGERGRTDDWQSPPRRKERAMMTG